MKNKKYIKLIILILLVILSNMLVFGYWNLEDKGITLSYKLISEKEDAFQLFYSSNTPWTEEQSEKIVYTDIKNKETLKFRIPKDTTTIRFDLGNEASTINVSDIKLSYLGKNTDININELLDKKNYSQIRDIRQIGNSLDIKTSGNNPYITYKIDSNILSKFNEQKNMMNNLMKLCICIVVDILSLILTKKSRLIFSFLYELKNNKRLIWNLSKNDFRTKYAGSYLGIFWAFIQPVITVLTYWFVFQVGFRSAPVGNFPFLLWLVAGLVPWFFFSEAIVNATNSMLEYSYLVKKVVFKVSILPIVKIVSSLFIHIFFLVFTILLFIIYGYIPTVHVVQVIYYTFCTFVLILGISYATAAIIIFFKDLGQIVAIVLQIGVWSTPIMWSYKMVPNEYQWILKLNPMYYIVEGYRDSFINHIWAWERYNQTIYFWVVALVLFVVGTKIFRKLKVHFADVL